MIWKRKFSFTELWVEQPGGTFKNLDHAPSLLENGGEKSDGKVSCRPLYSYPLYGLEQPSARVPFWTIRIRTTAAVRSGGGGQRDWAEEEEQAEGIVNNNSSAMVRVKTMRQNTEIWSQKIVFRPT